MLKGTVEPKVTNILNPVTIPLLYSLEQLDRRRS